MAKNNPFRTHVKNFPSDVAINAKKNNGGKNKLNWKSLSQHSNGASFSIKTTQDNLNSPQMRYVDGIKASVSIVKCPVVVSLCVFTFFLVSSHKHDRNI